MIDIIQHSYIIVCDVMSNLLIWMREFDLKWHGYGTKDSN
jgi:hypothetical protein